MDGETLARFREHVFGALGSKLEHATPENVRDFLEQEMAETPEQPRAERLELHETGGSYDEILREFFASVLENPTEAAMIELWKLAVQLAFHLEEQVHAERLGSLFGDSESAPS